MLKIKVVCVGKIKEPYLKDAVLEYSKRISKYADLEIVELPEVNPFKSPNDAEIGILLKKESEKILESIQNDKNGILLCVEGKQQDSLGFSEVLNKAPLICDTITFVIGGSYGLDESVKQKFPQKLSFSKMTFPHQLMRVILLEQIYRGCKILNHESYHK